MPHGAKSLVLIVDDPDAPDPKAPKMTYVHWVLFDLPPDTTEIVEGMVALPAGTKSGLNDWKRTGYGGPCPPIGRHRYFFKLYALDTRLEGLVGSDQGGCRRCHAGSRAGRGANRRHLSEGRLACRPQCEDPSAAVLILLAPPSAHAGEPPRGFVDAKTLIPDLVVEMRYATARNFIGRPIPGYKAPRCLLTLPAAKALQCAADGLRQRGYIAQGLRLLSPADGRSMHSLPGAATCAIRR